MKKPATGRKAYVKYRKSSFFGVKGRDVYRRRGEFRAHREQNSRSVQSGAFRIEMSSGQIKHKSGKQKHVKKDWGSKIRKGPN